MGVVVSRERMILIVGDQITCIHILIAKDHAKISFS